MVIIGIMSRIEIVVISYRVICVVYYVSMRGRSAVKLVTPEVTLRGETS